MMLRAVKFSGDMGGSRRRARRYTQSRMRLASERSLLPVVARLLLRRALCPRGAYHRSLPRLHLRMPCL